MTLDAIKLSPGDRVLDIACGTGVVARLAKQRLGNAGQVVGVDLSPDMLAVARALAPDIDWREGNASALPLGQGEQFDVVVCQQGLQFFPDQPTAVAQMKRAIAQDGRLAVTTWPSDDEIPFFQELRRVAERHLGSIVDQRYSFGEAIKLEDLLRNAGFHDVRLKTLSSSIRFDDGGSFVRMNSMAFVAMSAAAKAMSDEERKRVIEAIGRDSAPVLRSYSHGLELAFELSANLATAGG
jgi:ubiquinone/menaquinone biosynthesis C-methylase UbiE